MPQANVPFTVWVGVAPSRPRLKRATEALRSGRPTGRFSPSRKGKRGRRGDPASIDGGGSRGPGSALPGHGPEPGWPTGRMGAAVPTGPIPDTPGLQELRDPLPAPRRRYGRDDVPPRHDRRPRPGDGFWARLPALARLLRTPVPSRARRRLPGLAAM